MESPGLFGALEKRGPGTLLGTRNSPFRNHPLYHPSQASKEYLDIC